MEKNYNIDDIENFLNQEMDAAELAAFEKEMAKDEALKTEVNFHDDVVKGIQNAGPMAFKDLVSGVHAEMKTEGFFEDTITDKVDNQTVKKEATVRSISIFRKLAIAASFALLLTAGWFMFNQPNTPEQLFADNFTIHQDVLSVEIEDRLAETGFGTNKEALDFLNKGIAAYNVKEYTTAISNFENFERFSPEDALVNLATFYKAIAQVETNQLAKAAENLRNLSQKDDFALVNTTKWNLALVYLKQGDIAEAKILLNNLVITDEYATKATTLLNSLNEL